MKGNSKRFTALLVAALLCLTLLPPLTVPASADPAPLEAGKDGELYLDNNVTMEMVWIEPGTFTMGSPAGEFGRKDDEGQYEVVLTHGFWIGKYEVSQAQYEAIMGSNPSDFKDESATLPVDSTSWRDADNFCKRATRELNIYGYAPKGSRVELPTEAQWEYACRAGSTEPLYSGEELTDTTACPNVADIAWYKSNSGNRTHPVGQKSPNAWGLYDMIGNVAEWCLNSYAAYPAGGSTAVNPDTPDPDNGADRVLRGGSWDKEADKCRSAARGHDHQSHGGYGTGFRIVVLPPDVPQQDSDGNYLIGTYSELLSFARMLNWHGCPDDANALLTADIVAEGYRWEPIGVNYRGVFDGQGHTVTGLSNADWMWNFGELCVSERAYMFGLFMGIGEEGVVRRVGVIDPDFLCSNIESSSPCGVGGIAGINRGTVEDCWTCLTGAGRIEGYRDRADQELDSPGAGGIVGHNLGVVENCYTYGSVSNTIRETGTYYTPTREPGGVVGVNAGGTVTSCYCLTADALSPIGYGATAADTASVLTADQFRSKDSFDGWDFDTVWYLDDTLERPELIVSHMDHDGTDDGVHRGWTKIWSDNGTPMLGDSAWTSEKEFGYDYYMLPEGRYYLASDVDLPAETGSIRVLGTVDLCLNGHTLHALGFTVIEVGPYVSGTLNLYDENGNGGAVSGYDGYAANGDCIHVISTDSAGTTGVVNMYGGTLTEATGGGILISGSRAVVNMYGGAITGNGTYSGDGGVCVAEKGTFNMTGGAITGNNMSVNPNNGYYSGGGVVVCYGGVFYVSGNAVVTGNVRGGTFDAQGNLTGGTPTNVLLESGHGIRIAGELTGTLGVTMRAPGVFTSGLDGNGGADNFTSDDGTYEVKIDPDFGEALLKMTQVTVTFDGNGGATAGSETQTTQNVPTGTATELTENAFERRGYHFDGWNTVQAPDDTEPGTTYEDQEAVTLDAGLTLYAQWTPNEFAVTLDPAGPVTYDGSDNTPGIAVADDETDAALTLTDDYVISITKGDESVGQIVDAGTYTITVTGAGDYAEAQPVGNTFTVAKRTVTLTSQTGSKAYDGNPLTMPDVTVGGDGFVDGEVSDITATGSVTDVADGEVTNTITFTEGADYKADNYTITKNEGTLTVTPKAVTVTAQDHAFTYDGTAQSWDGYDVEGLVGNDAIEAFVTGSITFPSEGAVTNEITSYEFTSGTSSNYDVTTVDGELTMQNASAAITITAASNAWTYDGDEHTDTGVTLTAGELFTGDELVAEAEGSVTDVADTADGNNPVADGYRIMHGTEDVTASYVVTAEAGTLTVEPKAVTVTAQDHGFTYDGTAQSWDGYDVEGLVGNDAIEAVVSGSITFPSEGAVTNEVTSYEFTSGTASNYTVTTENGELTMQNASRPITITAASNAWTYDGDEHTDTAVTLTSGELFTGDELVAEAEGSVTDAADTADGNNPVADGYRIMHGTEDVTDSYVVTTEAGTLTVEPKAVTITADDKSKTYGEDDPELTATVEGAVDGEELAYTVTREEGDIVDEYTISVVPGDNPNYDVTTETGTFTILEADKTELSASIDTAKAYYDEIKDGYPEIAEDLNTSIAAAEEVLNEPNVLPSEIEAAAAATDEARELAEDKQAFEDYKDDMKEEAESLGKKTDSGVSSRMIEAAKETIDGLEYDETKTLDENKGTVDEIVQTLTGELGKQRRTEAYEEEQLRLMEDIMRARALWEKKKAAEEARAAEEAAAAEAAAAEAESEAEPIEPEPELFIPEDVSPDDWCYDAVLWAYANGIAEGEGGSFFPARACTRAEMVTLLWRASAEPAAEIDSVPFTDVSPDDWFYDAVLWAYENGITSGTTETTFSPDGTLTRAQAVTFLWRMAGCPAAEAEELPFADIPEDAWYAEAVMWAYENGITTGTTLTSFSPEGTVTRAQTVTFLYRCYAR